jgi:hypothetical protein
VYGGELDQSGLIAASLNNLHDPPEGMMTCSKVVSTLHCCCVTWSVKRRAVDTSTSFDYTIISAFDCRLMNCLRRIVVGS